MPPCAAGKRSSIYRGVTRENTAMFSKSTSQFFHVMDWKYMTYVTDYTRDLEEMQNMSREEYLASLRRKSSGFSRGISKYRGLSSRWEPSLGRMGGSEYFNSMHYGTGDDPATESEFLGAFCIERKFDLTSYIKWWGTNKSRQADTSTKSSEETKHGFVGDIGVELKTLEWEIQPTEPYQIPRLGISRVSKKHKGAKVSAMSILSRSAAYKNLQENASKKQENNADNDENENKNTIHKMDYGKAVEKSTSHDERLSAALGMSSGLSLQIPFFGHLLLLFFPLEFLVLLRLQRQRQVQLSLYFGQKNDAAFPFALQVGEVYVLRKLYCTYAYCHATNTGKGHEGSM
ncbi:AP2-like ethylene-responsive transcription factor [Prunus yedoensis var. nudiflora]|uniref:AP2-like ethylene-responsive transcription factor n=1 Tax=Prunus yedoensis var. nudiflora TaxID=2094558 RepID=A0A314XEN3_PRUYE|nr:AP2-like ethylene-responsive transcription factor [Prunus yedoensis var. nudiflora]